MNEQQQTNIDAAVFRRLLQHLDEHKEVQNIELMILADFCRNCLAKWMVTAAEQEGVTLDYEQAREKVYGMPYAEWKEKFQKEATPEQLEAFNARQK
ncbi:MAG: deoxycytidine triphosphate deaminase [Oceanospirillaceae bacterium]|nr:deoxycytidine triphosphate deaminase [Oceanospirillaceae bacterium]MBT12143.1 deoxycytidine triphosphate deaminase [Oceanospirillaceae bacterium]|tara:strand:- start:26112 stop:26402 length:291 start_codon:yes stop_codon:yes gene_type:complete